MNLLSRIRFVSRIRTVDSCRVFGRSIRIARSHANYLSHSYSAIVPTHAQASDCCVCCAIVCCVLSISYQ